MDNKKITWYENKKSENKNAVTLLFGGDFCPINKYEQKILAGNEIFDGYLNETFQKKDLSVVNLEAPLCNTSLKSIYPEGNGLRCSPEVCKILKEIHLDVAGIANNHLRDFGDAGVIETIETLDRYGIDYSGAGRNICQAQQIFIQHVGNLKIGIWMLAEKELNLADENRPGTAFFSPDANINKIPFLKEQVDFLVIFVHAGHEFMLTPSPRIRSAYRSFIDAGANLIVGHHPHVIQGIEQYGNGFIAYSLGNLVFDSPYVSANPYTDLGFLLQARISKNEVEALTLIPYYLRERIFVSSCDEREVKDFLSLMRRISNNVIDDEIFLNEWKENVKWRFNNSYYKDEIINFSDMFVNHKNTNALMRIRNKFACPTHQEFFETLLLMMENGEFEL